ncbi:hypothetical protein ACMS1M_003990 [Cronobacter dublinensis]
MSNINELTAKLKAAAERVVEAYGDEWFEAGRQICTVHKSKVNLINLCNPAAVLELIAAMEAAQNRNAELEARKVKLPSINPQMFNDDVMFGYRKAQREAIEFCAAAGITLETGGE